MLLFSSTVLGPDTNLASGSFIAVSIDIHIQNARRRHCTIKLYTFRSTILQPDAAFGSNNVT